jgi:hypothetical protein
MEGFYSKLFTKNVAMGGDVDSHALSVYTAGSSRQQKVFAEENKAISDNKDVLSESLITASPSQETTSDTHRENENSLLNNSGNDIVTTERKREIEISVNLAPISSMDKELYNNSGGGSNNTVQQIPSVSMTKEEAVAAAKERYLARKRPRENK